MRDLQPYLPKHTGARNLLTQWIHFIVDPLTSMDAQHRIKRNRYLHMICSALLTGNSIKFLNLVGDLHLKENKKKKVPKNTGSKAPQPNQKPPEPCADVNGIPLSIGKALKPANFPDNEMTPAPEWTFLGCWETRLAQNEERAKLNSKCPQFKIQSHKDPRKCSVHQVCPTDETNQKVGRCLDNQFDYLLHLAEDYQSVMKNEKEKINLWLQALVSVDRTACAEMKGIRNDYIMLMVGYLMNAELKGPFEELPTGCLQPLREAIATYISKRKNGPLVQEQIPLNPVSDTVEAFMNRVPKIDEGVFALLTISGNMFEQKRQ